MSEVSTVKIGDFLDVTDYVANGSFASLKENVTYREEPDFAVLVRLADHNSGWQRSRVYVDEAAYKFLKKSSVEPDAEDILTKFATVGYLDAIFEHKEKTASDDNVRRKVAECRMLNAEHGIQLLRDLLV